MFQGIAVLCFIMTWTMGFLYADVVKSIQISVDGVTGQEHEAVQKALEISNDLIKEEVVDEQWLKRMERQGPQRIREVLEPFGYYKPDVTVKLEASDEGSYRFLVTVKTGEPVRIKAIQVIAQGPGTSEDTIQKMIDEFPLRIGGRLRQDIYEEAKNNLLKKAISIGYLDAAYSKHSIRITLSQLSAEIDLILETGSKYYFGDISFTDQTGFPEPFLTRYLAFKRGEVYSQDLNEERYTRRKR
ncbi:MAG: outer rane surface protein [Deltaproteobacteria bacterium]|nr:outer rane surface protein [Deltaproteobacteria bacterium]